MTRRQGIIFPAAPLVRDSKPGDMVAVQAIYAGHVLNGTATFETDPPPLEEMRARRLSVLAHGCPFLVAQQGGQVIGFAYAGIFRTRPAFRHTVENSVYLDPAAFRQGAARALMSQVIARCGEAGFRQMIAVIGDENEASVAFHAAIGFRVAGRLEKVGFKFGRWLDTTLMQRALGPEHDATQDQK